MTVICLLVSDRRSDKNLFNPVLPPDEVFLS